MRSVADSRCGLPIAKSRERVGLRHSQSHFKSMVFKSLVYESGSYSRLAI